ncbi:Arabinoxylan arabinofuranohydrolase [Paenibacillus polymyxa E681]|uniref:carbohydrate-binding protein n=1 Tax=Paenibacillus polymyxa TaxID=1406 RepID=UPI0001E31A0A|nr:carbohydrate-binding protein [Paenibacillus polymyxa]ADM70106.1 arabinoxylan arabinofuranohydrolase [Paenibacillus polymyxa E681]QNV57135.1 Arabinoxylan arabinofuranohydrolase [Paenibacillus polymyxa E681]QNV61972.1 Arabinoxylan arabinofuranohydrolase [Paenibacillus polymyxa E681]
MIKKFSVFLLAFTLLLSCLPMLPVHAANNAIAKLPGNSNPLMDHKLGADPYALVYDGRVYIYMSSDTYVYNNDGSIKDNDFSGLDRIQVISSADMVNWTDHGAIPVAGANNKNNGRGIAKWASNSWAPAIAQKKINGKDKFFLYFANGGAGIGVLTADTPIGPWTDPLGRALVTHNTPGMAGVTWLFDPAVLVDDDGTGYLYSGGGIPNESDPASIANPKTARVIKLGADMTSVIGSATTIDAPYLFEDSGLHKYNGKYYYSYCINFAGTHPPQYPAGEIGYMVSDSPMGPFTYKGHFLKNPYTFFGVGGNNHHAVFNFKNEWYVVYHAQTVSKAQIGAGKGYRSPHINKLTHNGDGSIAEVQGNMTGIAQFSNLNPYTRVEAETMAWQAGVTTEPTQASGGPISNLNVTNVHNGDWIAVGNADFGSGGAKTFKANIASNAGGKIEIRLDSATGPLVGTLNVSSTGGIQTWKEVETTVSNATGVHKVFLVFTGTGTGNLFNIDYWQFTPNTTGTRVEAEDMTLGGTYAGKISSPFNGVALYANDDYSAYTQYFANSTHSISVRGASNNSSTARVDLQIGGTTVGSFYFTGTTPTVQTLPNITHVTGNQEVRLIVTTDNGTWDAYVDYLQFN